MHQWPKVRSAHAPVAPSASTRCLQSHAQSGEGADQCSCSPAFSKPCPAKLRFPGPQLLATCLRSSTDTLGRRLVIDNVALAADPFHHSVRAAALTDLRPRRPRPRRRPRRPPPCARGCRCHCRPDRPRRRCRRPRRRCPRPRRPLCRRLRCSASQRPRLVSRLVCVYSAGVVGVTFFVSAYDKWHAWPQTRIGHEYSTRRTNTRTHSAHAAQRAMVPQ